MALGPQPVPPGGAPPHAPMPPQAPQQGAPPPMGGPGPHPGAAPAGGPPGAPPGPPGAAPGGPPPGPPAPPPVFLEDVVALLRDDGLRGFRISIETDQMVEADLMQDQMQAMGFIKEVGGILGEAMKMSENPAAAAIMPAVGETIMFGVRKYRAGRQLEEVFETALQKAAWLMQQPKPPGPEQQKAQMQQASDQAKLAAVQIKAQAEGQKASTEVQVAQLQAQADMQRLAQEQQAADADHARSQQMAEMDAQIKRMDFALRQQEHAMEVERMHHEAALAAKDREHQALLQQMTAFGAASPAIPDVAAEAPMDGGAFNV